MDNKINCDENKQCLWPKDQALQYYMKFGRQRNLEKYMRLQHHVESPCSFGMFEEQQPHCSTVLPLQHLSLEISEGDEEKSTKNKNPIIENQCTAEKVIPIDREKSVETETTKPPKESTQDDGEEPKTLASTSSSDGDHSATLIRISKESIEAELRTKHTKFKERTKTVKHHSTEKETEKTETDDANLHTPIPQHSQKDKERRHHKNTPESATRSHRRLEWDSLGDVGYRRSKSSNNISVLERMVLNQLLQDCGLNNVSEKERKFLERLLQPKDGQMLRAKSLDSPPLASSTHMSHSAMNKEQQRSSPEQMEKSVQTTMSRSKKKSQHVQVDFSSKTSSDNKSQWSDEKLGSLEKLLEEKLENSPINKLSTDSESSLDKVMAEQMNIITTETENSLEKLLTKKHHNSPITQITTDSDISIKNSAMNKCRKSPEYDLVPSESLLETVSTDSFQILSNTNLPKVPETVKNEEKPKFEEAKLIERKTKDKLNCSYERSQSFDGGSSKAYMFNKSKSCEETNSQLEGIINSISDINSTREDQEKAFKEFQKILEKQLASNKIISTDDGETTQSRAHSRQSAQLELGIQLLCELIEARGLSKIQKKSLLCDVVRRICSITGTEPDNEILTVTHHVRLVAGGHEALQTTSGKTSKKTREISSNKKYAHLSPPSTSAAAAASGNAKLALATKETHTEMSRDGGAGNTEKIDISQATVNNVNNKEITTADITKTDKHTNQTRMRAGSESVPSKSSTSTDHSVKMSSKFTSINKNNNNNNDIDVVRKPEWLQPMTHSEFEYEQRQAVFAINADNRHAILHQPNLSELSIGKRDVLINWLDMEINRLERLRQLMLSARSAQSKAIYTTSSTSISTEELIKASTYEKIQETVQSKDPEQKQPLYDQVVSSMASVHNANKDDKRRQKQQQQKQSNRRETETNIIELVIEESKENMRKEKRSVDKIKYTQPAIKLGTLRERNNSLISTNVKNQKTPAEESSHSTTSSRAAEILPAVQQRSKMATPSSSIQSYSASSFEEKHKELHTMATQTTGGAEQGTQTRPTCECIHTEMGHNNNNYYYPYHACEHQRRHNIPAWHCFSNYACKHTGRTTYYTTPMTQGDNYIKQPTVNTTITTAATTTTTAARTTTTAATTTTTTSKTTQAAIETVKKSTATQIPTTSSKSSSSSSRKISSSSSSVLLTYTKSADLSKQQKEQEKSSSSSNTLPGIISSSEVSIPMGSNDNSSSGTTTTTHQYDDLDSIRPLLHNMAVQTSSTLLFQQIPEEVGPGVQTAPLRMKPKSIAYVLEFSNNYPKRAPRKYKSNVEDEAKRKEEHKTEGDIPRGRMTLQAHLERARPTFVAHTKERKALLNKLQLLRQQREKELRELIENTSFNSIERKLSQIPPPAIDQVRVFTTVQMKALTRKRARKLPEVLDREHREREERRRRGNRLLRDLFNRRLQKRVRIGQISLNHSKTVI